MADFEQSRLQEEVSIYDELSFWVSFPRHELGSCFPSFSLPSALRG